MINKKAHISCEKVCEPNNACCLNVIDLCDWNMALCAKFCGISALKQISY